MEGETELPLVEASLILEGGGQRGVFTSGVVRALMGEGLWLSQVYGVSMGACNGANYVSRQVERNRRVNIGYINDRRYLSFLRFFTGGELFGMDFIFDTVPTKLDPFDFKTYCSSPQRMVVGLCDCMSGEPAYFDQTAQGDDVMAVFRATCALPIITRPVPLQGRTFMDGGITDPIPIERSLSEGNTKHLVVLTQPSGYRKRGSSAGTWAKLRHPGLPGLHRALARRHEVYNGSLALVEKLEREGRALVIRPGKELGVKRICTDRALLEKLYEQGLEETMERMDEIKGFLGT